tara:strand:+ start:1352 stop:1510 length:159 start_codon:yes stop_codon:yes gene_type:complete
MVFKFDKNHAKNLIKKKEKEKERRKEQKLDWEYFGLEKIFSISIYNNGIFSR